MKIVLTHPTGNRNVRAILTAMSDAKLLAEFDTTIAFNAKQKWLNFLPKSIRGEVLRRSYPIHTDYINTRPLRETARIILPKIGFKSVIAHETGWACIDAIYRDLDNVVAQRLQKLSHKQQIIAVYAYEDGALQTFIQAKKLGVKCIYDLPIAYWETGRMLMKKEAERLPQWANTLGGGIFDSEEKLERKTSELELADIVVGPGSFVMDSIPMWAREKQFIVSPFGSPLSGHLQSKQEIGTSGKPLRILFVGSMGQRKGLGDLFQAMKLVNRKDVELVVLGSLLESMDFYRKEFLDFKYESVRPHDRVLELMRSCDVFCLPSVVEGRALVMQEAMSQGLPIIITPNTGGSDLVIEGETGFLVPVSNAEAIAEKICWFADNRSLIPDMGKKASLHAATYTWSKYGETVVRSLAEFL